MLDKNFFQSLANKMRRDYENHIFKKALDVTGKKFKSYSRNKTKWASILARKNQRPNIPKEGLSYGEAKKMGILQRQDPAFKSSTAPVLSGDLKNDAKSVGTKTMAKIRFAVHGEKINHLASMGRVLTSQRNPLPKSTIKIIDREVIKEIERKLPKSETRRFPFSK